MTDDLAEAPNDIEAERWLLGAMLASPAAVGAAVEVLEPGHFYRPAHQVIYGAMVAMYAAGQRVDPVTLRAELQANDEMRVLGSKGAGYLLELYQIPTVAVSVPHYAGIILGCAARRALLAAGWQLVREAGDTATEPMRLLEDARARLDGVLADTASRPVRAMTHDECLAAAPPEGEALIPGLLKRQERVVVIGPEGAGKSYLSLQVAYAAAAGVHPFVWTREFDPVRVLVMDFENSDDIVLDRMRLFGGIASRHARWKPENLLMHRQPEGVNLADPREAAALAGVVRKAAPQLIVAGPIYKMTGEAEGEGMNAAHRKVASFLDRLRARHGCALWLEAHTPYGARDDKAYRPEGSNIWSKWPEFGIALKAATVKHGGAEGLDVAYYRGNRAAGRDWPSWITHNHEWGWPWMANWKNGVPQ